MLDSISQRLPCPLAIWAFVLDGNLVQSCSIYLFTYNFCQPYACFLQLLRNVNATRLEEPAARSLCVCVCVRACVRVFVWVCVRAGAGARVRGCVQKSWITVKAFILIKCCFFKQNCKLQQPHHSFSSIMFNYIMLYLFISLLR